MSGPSPMDEQTNDRTNRQGCRRVACLVARAADGPLRALVLLIAITAQVLCWWCRCGDERVCPAVLHNAAAELMVRCGRKCGGGGDQTGVSGHLGRAAGSG